MQIRVRRDVVSNQFALVLDALAFAKTTVILGDTEIFGKY